MAGVLVSVLSNVLKDDYLPPVVENVADEVLITQRLGVNSKDIVGNQAVLSLHVGRSGGFGARRENEALPAAGYQRYQKLTYDLKYLYGRVQVTGQSMQKTKSGDGSFVVDILRDEMSRIQEDLTNDLARQFYGNGDGKVETCGVTSSSTTVVLASAEALTKGWLYQNMVIDIGTVANPVSVASARTITAINLSTPSITISGAAVTTAGTDFIFVASSNDGSGTKEIDAGLQKLVSTAANTVGGLDASTNPIWDNIRSNLSSGPLTYDAMLQMANRQRIAGGRLSVLITSFGIQRQFFNILQSQLRYQDPMVLKGGFEQLMFNGHPLIADRHAPFGKLFYLDERYIQPFADGEWRFLEEDGNVLKWVVDYDAWQAVLARYINMGITRRNVQGVIYGISDLGY